MSLKVLLLRKKIEGLQAEQATREKALSEIEERAQKATQAIAEIDEKSTAEERAAVENEVAEIEKARQDHEENLRGIKSEIEKAEGEIVEIEKRQKEVSNLKNVEANMATDRSKYSPEETRAREAFVESIRNQRSDYPLIQGNNGKIVPVTIANEIIDKIKEISPIYEKAARYQVKGTLEIPYYPYNAASHALTASFVSEDASGDASVSDFYTVTLTGYLARALALVSKKLVANTDVDVIPFVVEQVAKAFANLVENTALNGYASGGTTYITGILGEATTIKTLTYKSSVTCDDLIALQMAIPAVYQKDASWAMAPATLEQIRKLKDGENRYLLNPDVRAEFGYTLLGKPVYPSENMPLLGTANNKALLYGDLSGVAIKEAEQLEIEILHERYAERHMIGVVGFNEFDVKIANQQKIAVAKCGSADA